MSTLKKKKEKGIYELKLHETIVTNIYYIHRVPGGWIYEHVSNNGRIFIPFNDEFEI